MCGEPAWHAAPVVCWAVTGPLVFSPELGRGQLRARACLAALSAVQAHVIVGQQMGRVLVQGFRLQRPSLGQL